MCSVAYKLYHIHHEISSEDVMIIQYADDFAIRTQKNTDAMKKAMVDLVAQATELELSINGSKYAILIFGKQKTKETIEIENRREL
jgi:predicted phage tail protein